MDSNVKLFLAIVLLGPWVGALLVAYVPWYISLPTIFFCIYKILERWDISD